LEEVEPDLVRFGQDVITSMSTDCYVFTGILKFLAEIRAAGEKVAPPQLTQYDQWGRKIDRLQTSEGWKLLKATAQVEGIPAIFYERKYREDSRVYGFAKALLMVGDSHEVSK